MKRTHTCGALTDQHIGQTANLCGWVDSIRDHGGITFIDIRDRAGLTQLVFNPENDQALAERASRLKPESVIGVHGEVRPRPAETVNPRLPTGTIEVVGRELEIFNISDTPPFPIDDAKGDKVNEDLRLTHRYLDLRRPRLRKAMEVRHKASKTVREVLDEEGFYEIETPFLFKSTPEGAREYLVPSRLNPGEFYALTQSPQQFKQMLMVAGMERYYQMARCFRDEDLRSDRQPEFTQVDLEMSFIDREDMYALIEKLVARVWKEVLDIDIPTPFPRMPYAEVMNRYGIDKPDTRFGMELVDVGEIFGETEFKVFRGVLDKGGAIKAFNAKGLADLTQGELTHLTEIAQSLGAKGLAFIKADKGQWKSPILKFFTDAEKAALAEVLEIEDGDMVFFAADQWTRACTILGRIRLEAANLLKKRERLVIPADAYNFLWVVEFPLLIYEEEEQRFVAAHHPFTAPVPEDIGLLQKDPKAVRGQHYDLVLNGVELGGGSIRVHQPDLQKTLFEDIFAIPPETVQERFGYMLKSFRYGAPPHGGIALGFDRMVAILTGTTSIRDVIAFPKTQKGQCLMTDSPGPVTDRQLRDLHIQTLVQED
ncbi:MAG: aspartate--tRNA ligase [Opitutales bacterium]|nr:aspartate--tRNA ligase [Opitutales bacterium]MCH8541048.1 aspartate--tRNA ligase [Opitutales bacterium]